MKLTPLDDGRIAIVFTAEEDKILDELDAAAGNKPRLHATVVYEQLMQPSNSDLVKLIASLGMPLRR